MRFRDNPAALHRAAAGHTFLLVQKSMQKSTLKGGIAVSPLRIPLSAKGAAAPLESPPRGLGRGCGASARAKANHAQRGSRDREERSASPYFLTEKALAGLLC